MELLNSEGEVVAAPSMTVTLGETAKFEEKMDDSNGRTGKTITINASANSVSLK